jgi:hypothetical protein
MSLILIASEVIFVNILWRRKFRINSASKVSSGSTWVNLGSTWVNLGSTCVNLGSTWVYLDQPELGQPGLTLGQSELTWNSPQSVFNVHRLFQKFYFHFWYWYTPTNYLKWLLFTCKNIPYVTVLPEQGYRKMIYINFCSLKVWNVEESHFSHF